MWLSCSRRSIEEIELRFYFMMNKLRNLIYLWFFNIVSVSWCNFYFPFYCLIFICINIEIMLIILHCYLTFTLCKLFSQTGPTLQIYSLHSYQALLCTATQHHSQQLTQHPVPWYCFLQYCPTRTTYNIFRKLLILNKNFDRLVFDLFEYGIAGKT